MFPKSLQLIAYCGVLPSVTASVIGGTYPPLGPQRQILRHEFDKRAISNISSSCLQEGTPETIAPKTNVWSPISADDNLAVWNLLHDPATGLNLTDPSTATLTDNYVYWIDTLHTNKSDVVPYIYGDAVAPSKYSRAVIFRGGIPVPDSQEYMIGPLPVSAVTSVQQLNYIYNGGLGGSVPYNSRVFDAKRSAASEPLVIEVMTSIADITAALFQGGVYYGSGDNRTNLTSTSGTPLSFDGTQTFRNIMFRFPGPASYMTPLDLFIQIDCTGTDSSKYFLKGIVTNEKFYPSVKSFRNAFFAGELAIDYDQTLDASWALADGKTDLPTRPLEDRFAPSSLELGGKRYKVDKKERYVEYMGWTFYITFTRTVGIMFFDIRYKGERVLYELSLQEATAQYAGNQPKSAGTVYHDTYYSLGTDMVALVEGFDCPFGSTFWDLSYHDTNKTITNPDAVCIFEADLNFPISRHRTAGGTSNYGFRNLGVVKGSALTVRAIATIGNYDYMWDYTFHLEGSLEVIVRASGYLQSSFYYPDQGKWGPRIQEATQGSLHDHVLTYKGDFDIIDSSNSLQVTDLVLKNVTQPWFPELGTFEQMELDVSYMDTEKQFNYGPNGQTMYVITNKNQTNKWGEPRGYRIIPGRSPIHLSTKQSPFSLKNCEFAKSNLAITRQHDTEPLANSFQNINLPWKPQQDFLKFFDGESVDQEDLVLWFNLGMHHFTRSEDVPVTLYTEAYSSLVFAPHNFFDQSEDGDLRNRRWIVPNGTEPLFFDTYGVSLPSCPVDLEEPVNGIEELREF
jgi:primary-amine oxidase